MVEARRRRVRRVHALLDAGTTSVHRYRTTPAMAPNLAAFASLELLRCHQPLLLIHCLAQAVDTWRRAARFVLLRMDGSMVRAVVVSGSGGDVDRRRGSGRLLLWWLDVHAARLQRRLRLTRCLLFCSLTLVLLRVAVDSTPCRLPLLASVTVCWLLMHAVAATGPITGLTAVAACLAAFCFLIRSRSRALWFFFGAVDEEGGDG